MKNLILAILMLSTVCNAQIYLVDTNTPHSVGGTTIYGDPLPTAFTKLNVSMVWLQAYCQTNQTTNSALSATIDSVIANVNSISNGVLSISNMLPYRFSGTNLFNYSVASNKFDVGTWFLATNNQSAGLGLEVTNAIMQLGYDLTNNINASTLDLTNYINSASLDLSNRIDSVGLDLTNRIEEIKVPGTSGSETVLKIQSPDGSTWYLHVDNSGTLTPTSSP